MDRLPRRAGRFDGRPRAAHVSALAAPLLAAVLAAFLAVAGCGAAGGAVGGENPSPSPPAAGNPGQITNADSGRTVQLRVGDSVELVLRQEPGFSTWQGVQSSNPAVLAPTVDTRATAARGVTLASFRASAAGRATVTASAGTECSPGAACPALARGYSVTVVVTA